MTVRVGILISGGGSNMVTLVRSMTGTHPARPCVVVSNNPEAGGLIRARDMGLPAVAVDHRAFGKDRAAFEAALAEALAPFEADILCLAGFMRVLTAGFVGDWRGRMLNIHPSLLPKYRGARHPCARDRGGRYAGGLHRARGHAPRSMTGRSSGRRASRSCPATRRIRWPPACWRPSTGYTPPSCAASPPVIAGRFCWGDAPRF